MALFCVAALLFAFPGCGKYGPPVRTYEKTEQPAPAAVAPDSDAQTEDPVNDEGSGKKR